MMKLKLFLRNSVKPALLLLSLCLLLSLPACMDNWDATYKEKDIPSLVKKICKEEYNLDVTTKRTENSLWIYAAVDKLLHKDYGLKDDKFFDDELMDKLRNILTTVGRVLISSDNTPEFFALVASDIKVGIDYTIISSVLDTKKSYAGLIPWTEANRRYVIKLEKAPEAINDASGAHLKAYDIKLPDFLANQISQRITVEFQDETIKKDFKIEKCDGRFKDEVFTFEYSIQKIGRKKLNIREKILQIVTYCLKTYEFDNFTAVELVDLTTKEKAFFNRGAILARPKDKG